MSESWRFTAASGIKKAGLAVFALFLAAPAVQAENKLGGHFGVVIPLITHVDDDTIDVTEDLQAGFPMGITVKTSDKFAFDLELVAGLNTDPLTTGLTVHPGVLFGLGSNFTFGTRMAFEVNQGAWGFTPLLNKGFPQGNYAIFVEAVAPIRFQEDDLGENQTAITFGIHVGIGF
jgi:hypothetical protein